MAVGETEASEGSQTVVEWDIVKQNTHTQLHIVILSGEKILVVLI